MMKKTALLIGSVAAVALLAGGTFAAYTITDNANPFGVKVSPSAIAEDKTGNITLEWGESATQNIENLGKGATAKVGKLVLKASGKTYDEQGHESALSEYVGLLKFSLTDLSGTTNTYKLVDYLNIYLVEGEVEALPNNAEPIALDGSKKAAVAATGIPAGKAYTVFVKMNTEDQAIYAQMLNDLVYLEWNWDKKATDSEEVSSTNLKIIGKPNDWTEALKVYAYNSTTGKQNADWPGETVSDNAYAVSEGFDTIVFSSGSKQTENYTVDPNKPFVKIVADGSVAKGYKVEAYAVEPDVVYDYYLVGHIESIYGEYENDCLWPNGEDGYVQATEDAKMIAAAAMTSVDDGQNHAVKYNVELVKDEEFKVWKKGEDGGYKGQDENFKVSATGTYNIYYSLDGNIYAALVE